MSEDREPIAGSEKSDTGNLQQIQEYFQDAERFLNELAGVRGSMIGAFDNLFDEIEVSREMRLFYEQLPSFFAASMLLDEINKRYDFDRLHAD